MQANIQEVIDIIGHRVWTRQDQLCERFNLSEIQSPAIVEMRLRQLTGLEDKLHQEYEDILKQIEYLKSVLADIDL